MSVPLRVLITTDAFPPICGGSGWSTFELARGLAARGHHVEVLKVDTGMGPAGASDITYEGLRVTVYRHPAPGTAVVRNLVKNEVLWRGLARYLTQRLAVQSVDILHAQHVQTTVPTIRAGAAAGVPVVATVRDYWPVCYWSDLIYDPSRLDLCPACTVTMMTKCVKPRAHGASVAAWPVIPYMRANLRTKRRTLAKASTVIAVSSVIARDLERRAPELASTPLVTIPNPIDMHTLDEAYARASQTQRPIEGPYLLYAGKLAINKGVQFLLDAVANAGITWPLVVIGDGPLRGSLEAQGKTRGLDVRELGWLDREAVWTWMRHATMLAFPSYGPESLSRVLIEAAALGVPIAAMDTGGTRDIIQPGVTGLLSKDPTGFSADLARLAHDERLRAAIAHAARADVRVRFAASSVVERVEHVYRGLLPERAA